MKKIVTILTLLFAFSLSVSAQEKKATAIENQEKMSAETAAKNDAVQLTEYLGLTESDTENFYRLFELKYKTLENNLTAERKTELSRVIEAKIRATIGDDRMSKLEKNQELYNRLVN